MVRDISNYLENFFQQKIKHNEFTAYYAFINKQTIIETEDEVITKTRKGLTLEPRINWHNESPTFLKNSATNELYHVQVKNHNQYRVSCRSGFNSVCIVEKMNDSFNPRKVSVHYDALGIPFEMISGKIKIKYQEADFAGDHWYKKPSMYEIGIEKKIDYFLHEFLRFAVSSPYQLITPLEKAPAGAISIVENDKTGALSIVENITEGTLSFSQEEGNISVCKDYIPE